MKETIKADSLHRLNQQVTEFCENHLNFADNITIVTTFKGGEYVATIMPGRWADDGCKAFLTEECGYLNIFWNAEDIRYNEKASQYRLDSDQFSKVVKSLENLDMSEHGMSNFIIQQMVAEYGENMAGKKFLLYMGDDGEILDYEDNDGDPDDYDVFYADSLEEAEEQLRAKIKEVRDADPAYYSEVHADDDEMGEEDVWWEGDTLTISEHASAPGEGLSYPSMTLTACEEGRSGGWDVFDGVDENGKEVSFYGFNGNHVRLSEDEEGDDEMDDASDGINLDSRAWDAVEDGLTPEQYRYDHLFTDR